MEINFAFWEAAQKLIRQWERDAADNRQKALGAADGYINNAFARQAEICAAELKKLLKDCAVK